MTDDCHTEALIEFEHALDHAEHDWTLADRAAAAVYIQAAAAEFEHAAHAGRLSPEDRERALALVTRARTLLVPVAPELPPPGDLTIGEARDLRRAFTFLQKMPDGRRELRLSRSIGTGEGTFTRWTRIAAKGYVAPPTLVPGFANLFSVTLTDKGWRTLRLELVDALPCDDQEVLPRNRFGIDP